MNEDLMECESLSEMISVIKKYYDLNACRPSLMLKMVVIPQLVSAVEGLTPKRKRLGNVVAEMKQQNSVAEILQTLEGFFDLKNLGLTPIQKQQMIAKIPSVAVSLGAKLRR